MVIRAIQHQDRDKFMELIDGFYHSEAVLHPVDTKNYDITFSRCVNGDPFTSCFVYEDEGTVQGYILLSFAYSNEVGGMVVWIEEIYVAESMRGMKVGTKLLCYVHEKYKDSAKRFRLEATRGNSRAIKLYKSMGYEILDYMQMTMDI